MEVEHDCNSEIVVEGEDGGAHSRSGGGGNSGVRVAVAQWR